MEIIKRTDSGRAGGGKLNRSETVTVRLDPKLNYLCELAARAQRRTKSSFIEWAVAEAMGKVLLPEVREYVDSDDYREVSISERAGKLWHVDEPDRVVALALEAPALLNHEEQVIWKLLRENGFIWKGKYLSKGEWSWSTNEESLIRDRLRNHWSTFQQVAREELPPSSLPVWKETRDDPDDVIPF